MLTLLHWTYLLMNFIGARREGVAGTAMQPHLFAQRFGACMQALMLAVYWCLQGPAIHHGFSL